MPNDNGWNTHRSATQAQTFLGLQCETCDGSLVGGLSDRMNLIY